MPNPVTSAELAELLPLLPQLVRAMTRRMAEVPPSLKSVWDAHSLAPRHMNVLLTLSVAGPMSVTDLSARLAVGLATASLLVGELSRVGLVARREDEDDRRRTIVELAPAHREAVAGYLSRRSALLAVALAPLSPAERAGLTRGLRAIVDALESDQSLPTRGGG
jgi:DNA-binding MarR family transcriptional regulator